MSWNAVLEFEAACAEENPNEPPLDWLQAMLRQSMEEVMASEAKPLQKANALARLAGLYLKCCGATELKKENQALKRRLKEVESTAAQDAAPTPAPTAAPAAHPGPVYPAPLALPGSPTEARLGGGGQPDVAAATATPPAG